LASSFQINRSDDGNDGFIAQAPITAVLRHPKKTISFSYYFKEILDWCQQRNPLPEWRVVGLLQGLRVVRTKCVSSWCRHSKHASIGSKYAEHNALR
jgi:hypothetical protein